MRTIVKQARWTQWISPPNFRLGTRASSELPSKLFKTSGSTANVVVELYKLNVYGALIRLFYDCLANHVD